jgi:lipid-binding SYLF domain-containing protein
MFMMMGCATAPRTEAAKQSLLAESDAAVATMTAKDSSLRDLLDRSPGYAIYPNVGKGGAIIGGAYGRGIVYEHGRPTGFTELNQASIGAQLGGQSFSELIVFQNDAALNRLKAGNIDVGAEASAVALSAGAAKAANFEGGVAVFQLPKGGLMAAAAINGQKINYEPMDRSVSESATTASDRSSSGSSSDRSSTEMRVRTERSSDNADTATDRTQQRIDQRLDRGNQSNPQQ